jgi:hypothetical protein
VFPVRYERNSYILLERNSVSKGVIGVIDGYLRSLTEDTCILVNYSEIYFVRSSVYVFFLGVRLYFSYILWGISEIITVHECSCVGPCIFLTECDTWHNSSYFETNMLHDHVMCLMMCCYDNRKVLAPFKPPPLATKKFGSCGVLFLRAILGKAWPRHK